MSTPTPPTPIACVCGPEATCQYHQEPGAYFTLSQRLATAEAEWDAALDAKHAKLVEVADKLQAARERVTRAEAILTEIARPNGVLCRTCGDTVRSCLADRNPSDECPGKIARAWLAAHPKPAAIPDGTPAAPKERAIEFLSGCPNCGEEPETWNTMMEEPCSGCGRTLGCNLREDDNGVKHWSFYFAFENEEPEPDGASETKGPR